MKWNGYQDGITIQNFWIENPLTYVAEWGLEIEPSALYPALPVQQHLYVETLDDRPAYAHMPPAHRYNYLSWMSAGRKELPSQPGYLLLFLCGLERRALVDGADHRIVFDEVMRLRSLPENGTARLSRSFMNYSGTLLWLLLARKPGNYGPKEVQHLLQCAERWAAVRAYAALAWEARHYKYLTPLLASRLGASTCSHSVNGLQLADIASELQQLFAVRYQETFPGGISLRRAGVQLVQFPLEYHAANTLLKPYKYDIKLPQNTLAQVEQLGGLWDECVRALWPLATLVAGKIGQKKPLSEAERWESLPSALRTSPHPYRDTILSRLQTFLDSQQFAPVPLSILAGDCHIEGVSSGRSWTKIQSLELVQVLDYCGLAVEPDYRITGKAYGASDIVIVFVPGPEVVDSGNYQAAALMLQLGLLVANADREMERAQLTIIIRHIRESLSLNRTEKLRISALNGLLSGSKINTVPLKLSLVLLTASQRQSTAKMLIAVAAADGMITPAEMKHLKDCFTRLGLSESLLGSHLQQLQRAEVVQIIPRRAARNAGEQIPAPPQEQAQHPQQLDKTAIAALFKETRDVQDMLAEAISIQDAREKEIAPLLEVPPEPLPPAGLPAPVPPLYAAFYQSLMQRTVWPQAEANALANQHGHMLSGALEALNDWAIEQGGEAIFYEEGGQVVIEADTVAWA